jgi:hypothetical protein
MLFFAQILARLSVIIWEAVLPPSICALVTVITYLTVVNVGMWPLMFQSILSPLYVISLFVTL